MDKKLMEICRHLADSLVGGIRGSKLRSIGRSGSGACKFKIECPFASEELVERLIIDHLESQKISAEFSALTAEFAAAGRRYYLCVAVTGRQRCFIDVSLRPLD